MGLTKIEWLRSADGKPGYSLNPVKGLCPMACPYCYARAMYKRFGWNPEIRYIGRDKLFDEMLRIPRDKPQKIFIGSTIELFGYWIQPFWMNDVFEVVNTFSFFNFIFLTKKPHNLIKWDFPDNCWIGVSVDGTNNAPLDRSLYTGFDKLKAQVKFISFEPLITDVRLDYRDLEWADISWIICGQQTPVRKSTMPKIEWIKEIAGAADRVGIPVFIKDNLKTLPGINLRQEFPQEKSR